MPAVQSSPSVGQCYHCAGDERVRRSVWSGRQLGSNLSVEEKVAFCDSGRGWAIIGGHATVAEGRA